jgi:hypothetical protein
MARVVRGPLCAKSGLHKLSDNSKTQTVIFIINVFFSNYARFAVPLRLAEFFARRFYQLPACIKPSVMVTGCDSIFNVAGVRPSRFAVMVMAPGVSVERMATRLMPHSVSR